MRTCLVWGVLLSIGWLMLGSWQTVTIPEKLSDYGFFKDKLADQQPADGVVPYALNTPLFSDYAEKLRFVKLPAGQSVAYNDTAILDFPVGTTLIKTFYYPNDFRNPDKGRRLIETRLLIHQSEGWKALDYVWNEDQTDALLEVAGDTKTVSYIDANGQFQQHPFVIPNLNQCKGCHNRAEVMTPIGPSVRQLNGDLTYGDKRPENQLRHWQRTGILTGLPALEKCPKTPVWNKPETGSINDRARAWLDINCAHCHNPKGPAMTSGLNLNYSEKDPTAFGIQKTPVAAGRGSGGRTYDIVPGKPDESILIYRLESTDPGEMMPELGRKTVHRESLVLLKEWIKAMK
ncbi:SO2930 family diheme c-type cytochrome [Spirosoma aerolatum]|uniref:SO2930 family diheme c-type cytochrome n=1 Tax=Spirosoma aerolatum TaxID=1211326 RepID=UPI0009AD0803|nr:SO2930 family diheme c-type cytochrome [Spirosoma aerolatum]